MAYLQQIAMQGFKSFSSRKTTIDLGRGFTAIVGENGCGKSNILDAVCFVLGRLSSKSLRAENFASLLFNGGTKNSPAKLCRVSLVFNNKDRQFPIDADEITISREVDETGISAYRIGGKRVTRTEMLDTIAVAGLHPEGHNIVMQNELANVITMTPTEIRQVVEGVAGISVFDEKKQQIESELVKVDQNLHMVQLRTEEIRQEYTRLEKDRKDALRWREITDKLKQLERDLIFAELARIEERLEAMKEEFSNYSTTIEELETQRQEAKNRKLALEQSVQTDEAKIKKLDQTQHNKEIEATRIRELLKGLHLASEKISQESELLTASLEHLESKEKKEQERNKQLEAEITNLKTEEAAYREKIEPIRAQLSKLSKQTTSPDAEYLSLREEILTLTETIETKKSELGETSALLQVNEKRVTDFKNQIDGSYALLPEQESARDDYKEECQKIEQQLQNLETRIAALQEQRSQLLVTQQEKQNKQEELGELIQTSKEELLEAQTRLKTIREFKKYGLTRKAATDAVMKYAKENKLSGVYGTLGSLGKTSTKHATALEVAGGGRLDFIVVDTEDTATKCIEHLKKSRIGRATFIPLDTIKTNPYSYKAGEKGVIGNALDLLTFDDQFRPAFEYVFGQTLIVKDLKIARNIKAAGIRKITIDGDIVEPNRTLTGGFYKGISSLTLEEEARIPELQKKLKDLRTLLTRIAAEYQQWTTKIEQADEEIREKQKLLDKVKMEYDKAYDTQAAQEEALVDFKASITKLRESLKEEEETKETLETKLEKGQLDIQTLINKREELQQSLSTLERSSLDPNLTGLRTQLDEYESKLQETQLNLTEKTSEARYSKGELNRLTQDISDAKKELGQKEKEIASSREQIEQNQAGLEELEAEVANLTEQIQALETKITTSENESRQLSFTIDELLEEVNAETLKRSKIEGRIEQWQERYSTQKEKTEGLDPPLLPIDPSQVHSLRRELSNLQQERDNLGLINQKAVERFEEIRHAYDEILEKESRIREEREAILDAMRKAEEEKFRVFMASFTSISHNFANVYEQLTQGEGQLELENPENPFLGGIRMKVRPAGKRVQYLDALSGGEKALTALTFMFALQLHQPAPFYFLDEIDEALDPNNTERVARLISNLSENSQFLVISHNELTIRLAKTILGVALADGVSQVFSVQFEEGLLMIEGTSKT
ncbi:MAG: chromosome segregation protein SMC [Candidatus Thorarchaeota archaeon]